METNVALVLGCLAATRAGAVCGLGAERNRAMATTQANCGKSIRELLWEALMENYARLMPEGELADPSLSDPNAVSYCQGTCLGLAEAIAILTNPYRPDIDAIREECVERWEAQQKSA